jgi:predicted lipoprotein with Yx(FWY)xxD motif
MTNEDRRNSVKLACAILAITGVGIGAVSCGSDHGGLVESTATSGDTSTGTGGRQGASTTSSTATTGGSGGGGTETGGTGGSGGGATTAEDASSDTGGTDPGDDGGPNLAACVYHTERPTTEDGGVYLYALGDDSAAPDDGSVADADTSDAAASNDAGASADARDATPRSDAGKADAGSGDAGPAPSITVIVSPFLGPYLADSAGRSLFTYGADIAGDCNNPPISGCEKDCLIAWPLFYAGPRTLAPGLNDAAFGTIQRADLSYQTTYYGWPLYYFKTDLAPGMLGGQAKSKIWHAATVIPAGIVIMRDAASVRYIADGSGRTLYVYDQDLKGTTSSDPTSACIGTCLVDHPTFWRNRISVVSSLEPTDFSTFAPKPGSTQLAYKGAPLYFSAADARSGDVNGATTGWSVALP